MAYFDKIKVGDRVWDVERGYGIVVEIRDWKNPVGEKVGDFIFVKFDKYELMKPFGYTTKGVRWDSPFDGQTLFWDKIKFEISEKPKIELKENEYFIDLEISEVVNGCKYAGYGSGLRRDNKETAEKALKQIKNFMRLLALRDQECIDSRGYEFKLGEKNYCIFKKEETDEYDYDSSFNWNYLGVYFKTEKDAQKICDILNSGKFNLEGE